jgi:importin subunit beta-1
MSEQPNRPAAAGLLLPHAPSIFELIQRCLTDDERTDSLVKLAFGLVGDLADSFPNGQLKQLLLQEWIANELRNRRGLGADAKKTMRWAKEVSNLFLCSSCNLTLHALQMIKRATA